MILGQLQEMVDRMKQARLAYEGELEIAPEGRLVSAKKYKDHYAFYVEKVEQGKRVRKGITKQPRLVEALARKEFLRKVIPALDRNIALLQKTIDKYEPCQPQEIIESLSSAYGNVPEHCFLTPLLTWSISRLTWKKSSASKPIGLGDDSRMRPAIICLRGARSLHLAASACARKPKS